MEAIRWKNKKLYLLNQTALPHHEEWIECSAVDRVDEAIQKLEVRGAPAIGVAAAFGLVLAALESSSYEVFVVKAKQLRQSRPTAVNLMWAIDHLLDISKEISFSDLPDFLEKEAERVMAEDLLMNQKIGAFGAALFDRPVNIMTICNTGSLATSGYGTALGVIRKLHEENRIKEVFVCETRPLLQGARLTAYELLADRIPATLITDSMAAWTMREKKIDGVIVGADRIAANGDAANKIGTYGLALLANHHKIPFYIAAPHSTFDLSIPTGQEIPIEERNPEEVRKVLGTGIAPTEIPVFNPAFDVTPNEYITALITDQGVLRQPYHSSILNAIHRKGK